MASSEEEENKNEEKKCLHVILKVRANVKEMTCRRCDGMTIHLITPLTKKMTKYTCLTCEKHFIRFSERKIY